MKIDPCLPVDPCLLPEQPRHEFHHGPDLPAQLACGWISPWRQPSWKDDFTTLLEGVFHHLPGRRIAQHLETSPFQTVSNGFDSDRRTDESPLNSILMYSWGGMKKLVWNAVLASIQFFVNGRQLLEIDIQESLLSLWSDSRYQPSGDTFVNFVRWYLFVPEDWLTLKPSIYSFC